MTLYVLITEIGVDTVCETKQTANKERKYLKAMCSNVRCFVIEHTENDTCWDAVNYIQETLEAGKPFGRKGMRRLNELLGVTIRLI